MIVLNYWDCTGDKENPAKLPLVATKQSACADLYARLHEGHVAVWDEWNQTRVFPLVGSSRSFELHRGERVCVPTGWKIIIPHGYQLKIVPRSGMALKNGITVINSPGTIDSDYVKELMVILHNTSNVPFTINDGDRIAQMEVLPNMMHQVKFQIEEDEKALEWHEQSSNRRGGFGHTGS